MRYMRPDRPVLAHRSSHAVQWLLLAYAVILIYASLYPMMGWREVPGTAFDFLFKPPSRYWSSFDVVSNLVAYVPLGALLVMWLSQRRKPFASIVLALFIASALSLSMEVLQNYLPKRVPSWLDCFTNILGAVIGAAIAAPQAKRINYLLSSASIHRAWVKPESQPAVLLLLSWVLLQALPQSNLFITGDLSNNPLRSWVGSHFTRFEHVLMQPEISIAIEAFVVVVALWLFTVLLSEALTPSAPKLPIGIALITTGLILKTLGSVRLRGIEPTYWLTVGAQAGLLLGAVACLIASSLGQKSRRVTGLLCAVVLLILVNLLPVTDYQASTLMRWSDGPWRSIAGSLRHFGLLWPILVILWLLILMAKQSRARRPPIMRL